MNLKVDQERITDYKVTDIMVRASDPVGVIGTYDVSQLDKASVMQWMDLKPFEAKRLMLMLLGHEVDE